MYYSKVQEIDEDSCSSELYSGIITVSQQQNQVNEPQRNTEVPFQIKMARLCTSIFLIRRLLMVFIIVVIPSESYIGYKAWVAIILQIYYLGYLCIFKCFERGKDRMYELVNEITYLCFMIMFFCILGKIKYFKIKDTLFDFIWLNAILLQSIFLFLGSLYTLRTALKNKGKQNFQQIDQENSGDDDIPIFSNRNWNSSDEVTETRDRSTTKEKNKKD